MAEHDATTLTFVRTPAGVVKVAARRRVPHDVLPGELHRLLRSGSVIEAADVQADAGPDPEAGEHTPGDRPAPPGKPRRARKSDEG